MRESLMEKRSLKVIGLVLQLFGLCCLDGLSSSFLGVSMFDDADKLVVELFLGMIVDEGDELHCWAEEFWKSSSPSSSHNSS